MNLGHRTGDATIRIVDSHGIACGDTDVSVRQLRHDFAFGNIGFDLLSHANGEQDHTALADDWLQLFNTATLPFYWRDFEPTQGAPGTKRLRVAAEWFRDRGVNVKGHPLAWHTLAPTWLNGLASSEVERLQRERIRREVSAFAGLIDTWDAINEVVIMPVFDKDANAITALARERGRIPMIRMAFDEARAVNPEATLLLNDFDLSSAYECLIEGVLEAGIRLDAIGLQTHMHQGYWGEEKMLAMIDRFARYGLPLHLTESTILSGEVMPPQIVDLNDYRVAEWPTTEEGEARQAEELARHYRSLLSHPAVEAITYWGITDDGAWLGAPVGLVRADGSRKPSFDALNDLIKGEWWLEPTSMRTDESGELTVRGFFGDYEVRRGSSTAEFAVSRGDDGILTLTLD